VLRVLHHDVHSQRLALKFQDTPPAAAPFMQVASARGPAAAAAAIASATAPPPAAAVGGVAAAGVNGAAGAAGGIAPLLAVLSRGPVVVSSGGRGRNFLTVWSSAKFQTLDCCSTDTYGAAHALAGMDWGDDGALQASSSAGSAGVGAGLLPAASIGGSSSAASSSRGQACGGGSSASDGGALSHWRLLSGHERGQVVLWKVSAGGRQPGARALQLLSVIGEPRPCWCVSLGAARLGRLTPAAGLTCAAGLFVT
jgi:hypothetical protein